MKKIFAFLLIAALLVSTLTGCAANNAESSAPAESSEASSEASQEESSAPAESSEASQEEESKPAEAEEINFRMCWWGGDTRHEATLKMFDYYKENIAPNVTIEGEYQGWDGYYEKLLAGLMAGTAPELIQNNVRFIKTLFAAGDFFTDLNTVTTLDMSTYDANFLAGEATNPDGKLIGAPTGMNAWVMLINKDFFEKYGIDYNIDWTWDDIETYGKQIHEQDPEAYILWNILSAVRFDVFSTYVGQVSGTNFFYDDYTMGATPEAILAGCQMLDTFTKEGVLAPLSITNMSVGSEEDGFRTGMSGLTFYSASSMAVYADMNLDVVNMPVIEGATNTAIGVQSSQIMSIPQTCQYPQEAGAFLNFMLNEEEGVMIGKTERGVPASSAALDILNGAGILNPLEYKALTQAQANAGVSYSGLDIDENLQQVRSPYIEAILYGEMTPEDAAQNIVDDSLAALAEMKEAAEG